jgi:predicted HTH domain antitoxin
MTELAVSIPDDLLGSLRKAPHEMAREMRIASAIHWYGQGLISMGRAAEAAGMDRPQFLAELARRKVDVFVVDEEDLARELKGV